MTRSNLSDDDYRKLLAFRTGLRRFLRWSEQSAEQLGITATQHQLLLAVRGHENKAGPTIGELTEYLLSQHHSVSELVQRTIETGLVRRHEDPNDRRVSRVQLTQYGEEALERLSAMHIEELSRLENEMSGIWERLEPTRLNSKDTVL